MVDDIDTRLDTLYHRASSLDQMISSMLLERSPNHMDHTYNEEMSDTISVHSYRYNSEDGTERSEILPLVSNMNSENQIKIPFRIRYYCLMRKLRTMELRINQSRIDHTSNNKMAANNSADLDNTEDGNVSSKTLPNEQTPGETSSKNSGDLDNTETENGSFPLNEDFDLFSEFFQNDSSSRVSSPIGESDLNTSSTSYTSRALELLKSLNSIRVDLDSLDMYFNNFYDNEEIVSDNAPIIYSIVKSSGITINDDERKSIMELLKRIQIGIQCTN